MTETLTLPHPALGDARVFETHQELLGRPAGWFAEAQQAAWRRYLETPLPARTDERWRFANMARLRELDGFELAVGECPEAAALAARSLCPGPVAGHLVLVDDTLAAPVALEPELAARGVVFTTLIDAIAKHPELVRAYFMKQTPELGSEKFEALHVALLRNGVFLHVPDGVVVERPFVVHHWAWRDKGALFPHTLFVTGRNAAAALFEFQQGARADTRHMVVANAHLHAGDGARVRHVIVQDWNLATLSLQLNTNSAHAGTDSKSTLINLGSAQVRQEVHGRIFGSGSNVEMFALNVPSGTQEFDQRTLQTHIAPQSRSDLLFKNALMDRSRTIFSGLIIVEENAQQTDAYQRNTNLMLSEEAEANSLPGLEIKANDVKCTHGATAGRIDESELFYFLARGIPRKKAQELMVHGFFEEIVAKLENEALADTVRALLEKKFAH